MNSEKFASNVFSRLSNPNSELKSGRSCMRVLEVVVGGVGAWSVVVIVAMVGGVIVGADMGRGATEVEVYDDGEEGNDDDDDQKDDKDDDEDDEEEGSDDGQASDEEEFIHPSLSTHAEEETRDEESFDPISKTPENSDDEGNGKENLGINVGREEGHDEEEEEDELYIDVNITETVRDG
nr:hypothetical protein [Tanacetum cinerariifolium]